MSLTFDQRLKRLRVRSRELASWLVRDYLDLEAWSFDGAPIALGASWPHRQGTVRFEHPEVQIPGNWPLEDTRLELSMGGESLVHIRYSNGDKEPWGVDPFHQLFPLKGPAFSLDVEAVARRPFGPQSRD